MKIIKCGIISTVIVLLMVFFTACSKLENPSDVSIDEIITLFRMDTDELRANGVSETTLIAQIPNGSSSRIITFKTNKGIFIGPDSAKVIQVPVDMEGKATVTLRTGIIPGTAYVSASISEYLRTEEIKFLTAYADQIIGETSSLVVTTDGAIKATLVAILSRYKGAVSLGTEVEFKATQINDRFQQINVGRFIGKAGAKTDEEGKASITFAADTEDVIAGRPISIKMITQKDDGSYVEFPLTLVAQGPITVGL
jgi:hypothetical protein